MQGYESRTQNDALPTAIVKAEREARLLIWKLLRSLIWDWYGVNERCPMVIREDKGVPFVHVMGVAACKSMNYNAHGKRRCLLLYCKCRSM